MLYLSYFIKKKKMIAMMIIYQIFSKKVFDLFFNLYFVIKFVRIIIISFIISLPDTYYYLLLLCYFISSFSDYLSIAIFDIV
jgi:hypothetical protein